MDDDPNIGHCRNHMLSDKIRSGKVELRPPIMRVKMPDKIKVLSLVDLAKVDALYFDGERRDFGEVFFTAARFGLEVERAFFVDIFGVGFEGLSVRVEGLVGECATLSITSSTNFRPAVFSGSFKRR